MTGVNCGICRQIKRAGKTDRASFKQCFFGSANADAKRAKHPRNVKNYLKRANMALPLPDIEA